MTRSLPRSAPAHGAGVDQVFSGRAPWRALHCPAWRASVRMHRWSVPDYVSAGDKAKSAVCFSG